MGSEFLLEIGTEEIPARFIPPAMEEMAASFRKKLAQERLEVGEIITWGTPRRLTLVARDMAEAQSEVTQEMVGPPKAVAYGPRWQAHQGALQGLPRPRGWRWRS